MADALPLLDVISLSLANGFLWTYLGESVKNDYATKRSNFGTVIGGRLEYPAEGTNTTREALELILQRALLPHVVTGFKCDDGPDYNDENDPFLQVPESQAMQEHIYWYDFGASIAAAESGEGLR